MKDYHTEWHIAVKTIPVIDAELNAELERLGAQLLDCEVPIHAHFFIPPDKLLEVEPIFQRYGFRLLEKHPNPCSIGERPGFEIYEKRVPIIEAREVSMLTELAEYGVQMSGGSGRPHIHIRIPTAQRGAVLKLLDEQRFYPKGMRAVAA